MQFTVLLRKNLKNLSVAKNLWKKTLRKSMPEVNKMKDILEKIMNVKYVTNYILKKMIK